jgi:cytochrome c oxidase assembly factor CtaG
VVVSLVALVGVSYVQAVRHLRRSGVQWPLRRTVSMLGCLVLLILLLCPGLAILASTLLGPRVAQVLTLATVVPMLLTTGRPVLLVRRLSGLGGAAPGWTRALADPVNGLAILLTLSVVLYATPLLGLRLQGPAVEHVVGLTALTGGFLFFWPLLALDWTPEKRAARDRFVLLLFACGLVVVGAAVHRTAVTFEQAWPAELDLSWGVHRSWTVVVLAVHALVLLGVACWLGMRSRHEGRAATGPGVSR